MSKTWKTWWMLFAVLVLLWLGLLTLVGKSQAQAPCPTLSPHGGVEWSLSHLAYPEGPTYYQIFLRREGTDYDFTKPLVSRPSSGGKVGNLEGMLLKIPGEGQWYSVMEAVYVPHDYVQISEEICFTLQRDLLRGSITYRVYTTDEN